MMDKMQTFDAYVAFFNRHLPCAALMSDQNQCFSMS